MALSDAVRADIEAAMRAGDRERVGALRLILSELQKAQKVGDSDELAVLRRERKRRLEAAEAFRKGGREDLAVTEEGEAELIGGYLPPELADAELRALVARVIGEVGAGEAKDMGRVMGPLMDEVAGRADGKRVSALVREALGS